MFLNNRKLEKNGFKITIEKDGIRIEPKNPSSNLGMELFGTIESNTDLNDYEVQNIVDTVINTVNANAILKLAN